MASIDPLDRLAELGRAVEKTRKWDVAFGEGTLGAALTAAGRPTAIVEVTRAALAERMKSELELAEECKRLRVCGACKNLCLGAVEAIALGADGLCAYYETHGPRPAMNRGDLCHFDPSCFDPLRARLTAGGEDS